MWICGFLYPEHKEAMRMSIVIRKLKTRIDRLFTKSNCNLLIELIRAKFKVTDHNSILGVFWSLIGPIFMLIIIYFIFKNIFGQGVYAYPLYLLVGIVCVSFFTTATTYIIKAFFFNREIVLNSMVSREIFVLSDMSIHAYKFVIEILLCLIISAFYGSFSWGSILLLFPLSIGYIALVLGVGIILSLFYCFARDIEHIWMIISRLFFFATPIFYTLDRIPPSARKAIYWGNPLTPFLISFRDIILKGESIDISTYLYSIALGIIFFIIGYILFIILENTAVERA